ncbi:uncharacterized protein LOC126673197 [Mercurialis annua]|uniref:uncharacterized protein LOC126673197 n=1 Tax=Mercurialis annua TaxID=3986 RepID=UPI0021604362|nr:uncharacterized protein LOC126673197 [Mercurialis annua]
MAQQNGMIKSVTDVNFLYPNQFNLQPQNAFPADPFMPQNLAYQLQYFSFMPQMQSWNQQLPADRHQQLNRDAPILPTSVDPPQHALSLLPNPSTSRYWTTPIYLDIAY